MVWSRITAGGLYEWLISVDWLTTHCHVPFCFTHVSVNLPRR